jgi:hypothetical protein
VTPDLLATLYAPSSATVGSIAAALCKAQGVMRHATKDNTNPQTRSTYADLAGILDVSRAPLSDNGLSVVQAPYALPLDPPRTVLLTTLLHESGEWMRSVTPVNPRAKVKDGGGAVMEVDDMQTTGAAITYARRYALAAMLGIGQEDDDGNAASGRARETARAAARPARQERPSEPEPATVTVERATRPQLDTLAAGLKAAGVPVGTMRPIIAHLVGRDDAHSGNLTHAEAARLLNLVADRASLNLRLEQYQAALDGGPPPFEPEGARA